MKEIKFSHNYKKLPENWEGTCAVLLSVSYIPDLERWFLKLPQMRELDAKFRGEEGYYQFDFKEGLLLIFLHLNSSKLFSTIRRFTDWKWDYYKESVYETFILEREKP